MTKLLRYHTTMISPDYYRENNQVATKLKNKEITTYAEYEKACQTAGCNCSNEEVFNNHLDYEDLKNECDLNGLENQTYEG